MQISSRYIMGDKEYYKDGIERRMTKQKLPYKYSKYISRLNNLDWMLVLTFDNDLGTIKFRTSLSPNNILEDVYSLIPLVSDSNKNLPIITCTLDKHFHTAIQGAYSLVYELTMTGYSELDEENKIQYLSKLYEAVKPYHFVSEMSKRQMFMHERKTN